MASEGKFVVNGDYVVEQVKEALDDLVHPVRTFRDGLGLNRDRNAGIERTRSGRAVRDPKTGRIIGYMAGDQRRKSQGLNSKSEA